MERSPLQPLDRPLVSLAEAIATLTHALEDYLFEALGRLQRRNPVSGPEPDRAQFLADMRIQEQVNDMVRAAGGRVLEHYGPRYGITKL